MSNSNRTTDISDKTIASEIDKKDNHYRAKLRKQPEKITLTRNYRKLTGVRDMLQSFLNHTLVLNTDTIEEIKSFLYKERTREKTYKEQKIYDKNMALFKLIKLNQNLKSQKKHGVISKDISTTFDRSIQSSQQQGNYSKDFFPKNITTISYGKTCNTSKLEHFLYKPVKNCKLNATQSYKLNIMALKSAPNAQMHDKELMNLKISEIQKESKLLLEIYSGDEKTDEEYYSLNPDQFKMLSEKLNIDEHYLKEILKSVIYTETK